MNCPEYPVSKKRFPRRTINRAFALLYHVVENPLMSAHMTFQFAEERRRPCPCPPVESHFTASEAARDVVIGMTDGLSVPFAFAAGLSGAVGSSGIVVTA